VSVAVSFPHGVARLEWVSGAGCGRLKRVSETRQPRPSAAPRKDPEKEVAPDRLRRGGEDPDTKSAEDEGGTEAGGERRDDPAAEFVYLGFGQHCFPALERGSHEQRMLPRRRLPAATVNPLGSQV
jgi:hypothetical protein